MSKQQGRAYAVRSNGKRVTFLAATETLARDGLILNLAGMDTWAYEANPIVLFGHNYGSMPIGRTTKLERTSQGLVAEMEFDEEHDETAALVAGKIRRNFLNAASIGWDSKTVNGNRVETSELLDISIVAVPGDATALALARSAFAQRFDLDEDDPAVLAALLNLRSRFLERDAARVVSPERIRAMVKDELIARYGR